MTRSITQMARTYVTGLFNAYLPARLTYHNSNHTEFVVNGVKKLCDLHDLDNKSMETALLAAWFHDTGFIHTYIGHESKSQEIASNFLRSHGYPEDQIVLITDCIESTRHPQHPSSIPSQILCDADLMHLAEDDYWKKNKLLKNELEACFDHTIPSQKWYKQNLEFLQNHRYFTPYGKTILTGLKEKHVMENIKIVKKYCTNA